MYTVCPKCTLTLAITAADLRVGQGYVRCGRCGNVFNALLTLSDQPQGPPAAARRTDTAAAPGDAPGDASSDAPGDQPAAEDGPTGTFETIVLEGDAITQTEEVVPQSAVFGEIEALTRRLGTIDADAPVTVEPAGQAAAAGAAARGDTAPVATPAGENPGTGSDPDTMAGAPAHAPADGPESHATAAGAAERTPQQFGAAQREGADDDMDGTQRSRQRRWPWTAGSVLLALALAAQMLYHWRDALAALPRWGPPLTRVYRTLGVSLDPHWNLAAYDVRQQGAVANAGGSTVSVRFSLMNRAPRAQPVPLIRLTLLDSFGRRIATRELAPADYWPHGLARPAWLASEQRVEGEISVKDPAADSASFELDVCLPESKGAPLCASQSARGLQP